ncbi:hypothetical protein GOODEAATRI_022812, partial [Goodea atripinnis]
VSGAPLQTSIPGRVLDGTRGRATASRGRSSASSGAIGASPLVSWLGSEKDPCSAKLASGASVTTTTAPGRAAAGVSTGLLRCCWTFDTALQVAGVLCRRLPGSRPHHRCWPPGAHLCRCLRPPGPPGSSSWPGLLPELSTWDEPRVAHLELWFGKVLIACLDN